MRAIAQKSFRLVLSGISAGPTNLNVEYCVENGDVRENPQRPSITFDKKSALSKIWQDASLFVKTTEKL
jgi:hypothetical protein